LRIFIATNLTPTSPKKLKTNCKNTKIAHVRPHQDERLRAVELQKGARPQHPSTATFEEIAGG
jgi:hypothetical protein